MEKSHQGKCTSCHAGGTLLFSPFPWGEMLDFEARKVNQSADVRKIPQKIADELKDTPGYPFYYGINLEKYKTESTTRVVDMFNSLSRSENFRSQQELCSLICQQGDQNTQRRCRQMLISNALKIYREGEEAGNNVLMELQLPSTALYQEQKKMLDDQMLRLKGQKIRKNNLVIPDRDPFTEKLYRNPQTPEEQAMVQQRIQQEMLKRKGNPSQVPFDPLITKIEIPAEDYDKFRVNGANELAAEITEDDLLTTFAGTSCFNLNDSQKSALSKITAEQTELFLTSKAFENLLQSSASTDQVFAELMKMFAPTEKYSTDEQNFCPNVMTLAFPLAPETQTQNKKTALAVIATLPKEERAQNYVRYFCGACHGSEQNDDLPIESLSELKKYNQKDSPEFTAQRRLERLEMPPQDSEFAQELTPEIREEILRALTP